MFYMIREVPRSEHQSQLLDLGSSWRINNVQIIQFDKQRLLRNLCVRWRDLQLYLNLEIVPRVILNNKKKTRKRRKRVGYNFLHKVPSLLLLSPVIEECFIRKSANYIDAQQSGNSAATHSYSQKQYEQIIFSFFEPTSLPIIIATGNILVRLSSSILSNKHHETSRNLQHAYVASENNIQPRKKSSLKFLMQPTDASIHGKAKVPTSFHAHKYYYLDCQELVHAKLVDEFEVTAIPLR